MKRIYILIIIIIASVCGGNRMQAQNYSPQENPLSFYSEELKQIYLDARQLNTPNMVRKDQDAIVAMYNNHLRKHQEDKAHCYFYIGEFLRQPANMDLARPMDAFQNYQDGMHCTRPSDSITRGSFLYRMGQCHAYRGNNFETALRYYVNSITIRPNMATTLADLYLFGWGVEQDPYLASTYYDISQRNGEPSAYESNYCLYYIIGQKQNNYTDSISLVFFERFVYNLMINRNNAASQSALMAAAQMEYPPAEYEMGARIEHNLLKLPGMKAEEWYETAIEHGYAPAIGALAELYAAEADKSAESAKRYLKLMHEAEINGHSNIKLQLGKIYAKGNKYGYPKKDLKKAYQYLLTAYRIGGTSEQRRELQKLTETYKPSPEVRREIQRWSDSASNYYNSQCDSLFNMISRHPRYGAPRLNINNSYFQQNPERLANINPATLDKEHAQHYLTAYNLYADLLKQMSLSSDSKEAYISGGGSYLQHRMKGLRERAEKMPVNLIKESLWEKWDGE